VGVAQLVELLVVVQAVAGSNPVVHPRLKALQIRTFGFRAFRLAERLADEYAEDLALLTLHDLLVAARGVRGSRRVRPDMIIFL
jgi:hypothetical protein